MTSTEKSLHWHRALNEAQRMVEQMYPDPRTPEAQDAKWKMAYHEYLRSTRP